MGKAYNKRKGKGRPKRNRQIKKVYHIICEGKNTEPDYFKSFPLNNVQVKTLGLSQQHTKLVQSAIEYREGEGIDTNAEDEEIWVVFDYDIVEEKAAQIKQDFNRAIDLASKENIYCATSNDCFELWYVLHFAFIQNAERRGWYYKKLSKELGISYSKNKGISKRMYSLLEDKQTIALKNAEKLEQRHNDKNPCDKNPFTSVYKLVEKLNKDKRQ